MPPPEPVTTVSVCAGAGFQSAGAGPNRASSWFSSIRRAISHRRATSTCFGFRVRIGWGNPHGTRDFTNNSSCRRKISLRRGF